MTDCHRPRQSNSSPSSNILPYEQIILDSVGWVPIPFETSANMLWRPRTATSANMGQVPIRGYSAWIQFRHWTSSSGTGPIKLLVFRTVPARGALYWHGDDLGTSASQFQHGAKNRSQFQHWASANMGANIYTKKVLKSHKIYNF